MNSTMASIGILTSVRLQATRIPYRCAMLLGVGYGVVNAIIAALTLGVMLAWLPKELWGASAAAGLSTLGPYSLLLIAVFFIPFIETFIGQLLPLELAKRIGLNNNACILAGGIVFGLGHYINGGLAHGIATFIGGLVLSSAYMLMRPHGYLPACLTSYVAHASTNFLLMFVMPLIFPSLG